MSVGRSDDLTHGTAPNDKISPYASAAVMISMFYHATCASYEYARYSSSGELGYALGCAGSSFFAAFGLWVLMFGDDAHARKQKVEGKRTSGWLFKNKNKTADEQVHDRKKL
jgi:hypothetical protein